MTENIRVIIITNHILNVYFPCLHGLDRFLNGYLPLSSILYQIKINLQRSKVTIYDLIPSLSRSNLQYYIFVFLHHAIITASLYIWPNHLNLPLMQYLMLSRPKRSLTSEEGFLSFKVTLHIHCIILIIILFVLEPQFKSASFTAEVSLPHSITLLTHAWYTLANTLQVKWETPTQVRTGRRFLNSSIMNLHFNTSWLITIYIYI